MVLALALLIVFIVLVLLRNVKEQVPIFVATISLLLVTWITQILVTAELLHTSPDLTYGSDARFYWHAALKVLGGEAKPSDFPAPIYVFWEALVVKLSPGVNFLWVLLANSLIFSLAFLFQTLAILGKLKQIKPLVYQREYFAITFIALSFWINGVVLWMVARGMKEVLIIFFLSFMMFLHPLGVFQRAFGFGVALLSMSGLRPLGMAIPLVAMLVESRFFPKVKSTWLFFVIVIVVLTVGERFLSFIDTLSWFRQQFGEEAARKFFADQVFSVPVLGYWVAFLRFVLGPGPFRSLEQILSGGVFEESTRVGDFLIFLGSIHWWAILAFFALSIFLSREASKSFWKVLYLQRGWFFMGLTLAATYAYIYFGTGDTRHRALLYLLWSPVLVTHFYILCSRSANEEAPPLPHHPR